MNGKELKATIFDIQGYSVHDGPGGRTLIFFKGCPLRCYWCCNPEGLNVYKQVIYRRSKCQKCYNCTQHCPQNAISFTTPGEFVTFDREICKNCETHECVKACYHEGLKIVGKEYTIKELMKRIERDRRFWSKEGGVTLGGGEVMRQFPFVLEFVKQCQDRAIHVAIETSGAAPEEHFMEILPYLDWIFMDIKHMDPVIHKEATGISNEQILKNIRYIAQNRQDHTQMVVRIPVIIGFNDSKENITATSEFVKSIGVESVNLLPFHRLGTSKYEQLDMDYICKDMTSPELKDMERVRDYVLSSGINCYIGSDTPF